MIIFLNDLGEYFMVIFMFWLIFDIRIFFVICFWVFRLKGLAFMVRIFCIFLLVRFCRCFWSIDVNFCKFLFKSVLVSFGFFFLRRESWWGLVRNMFLMYLGLFRFIGVCFDCFEFVWLRVDCGRDELLGICILF